MSEENNLSITAFRRKRGDEEFHRNGSHQAGPEEEFYYRRSRSNRRQNGWHQNAVETEEEQSPAPKTTTQKAEAPFLLPFDPWRLLEALREKWYWLLVGAGILALAGWMAGVVLIKYKIPVHLIRRETSNAYRTGEGPDPYKPREISEQTLMTFMKSAEVIRRVSAKSSSHIPPDSLFQMIKVEPTQNPDILTLALYTRNSLPAMVDLANLYAHEVIDFTKEMQATEVMDVAHYLDAKLAEADKELSEANEELVKFSRGSEFLNFDKETEAYVTQVGGLDIKAEAARIELGTLELRMAALQKELATQNPANDKITAAKEELNNLLLRYTDAHPLVQAQKSKIAELQKQTPNSVTNFQFSLSENANSIGNSLYRQYMEMQSQKTALEKQIEEYKLLKNSMQGKVTGLSEKTLRYAMLKTRLQAVEATRNLLAQRKRDAQLYVENAMGYYRIYSDASLKDVNKKIRWLKILLMAFAGGAVGFFTSAAAIMIAEVVDTRLRTAADVTRVTGLPVLASLGDLKKMSPEEQVNWAFKTLTALKGKISLPNNQGLVCGITSSEHGEGRSTWINLLVSAASQRGFRVLTVDTRPHSTGPEAKETAKSENAPAPAPPATNVLAAPAEVTQQLTDPSLQPIVHIPLPGWVWNYDRRKQWQTALTHWKRIDNLVLLVELPPATEPEAVLLAENLPQVLWLAGSGMAKASETVEQLTTLRNAHCNLVGAVLNREPSLFWKQMFSRIFVRAPVAMLLGLLLANQALGQPATPGSVSTDSTSTNKNWSISAMQRRAAWQQHLTLGPGDAMDIYLLGNPELSRTNIFVGPDGRLSYLQAQDLYASGLTIDELRARLDEVLGKYYRSPRTIVVPVSYNSKKYFVLGKVARKGVYVLDRPITVLEAVARARGLETGLYQRNSVELADLSHSFLMRNGKKVPINFEKLFNEGDLSQNLPVEPNDYLYFAAASSDEIYVLGEVLNPGPMGLASSATIISALTDRGGFTRKAFKQRVLVIRGSLERPETFVVNMADILGAKKIDFKLEPHDIVYVSARPWAKIEELLDDATQAFIQGAVTAWTGANIGPVITSPILPQL